MEPSFERFAVAAVPAGVGAVLLYAVLRGLGVPNRVSLSAASGLAVVGASWLSRRLPRDLDGALRRHTLLACLWLLLGIAAIGATVRLATFMVDETKVHNSMYAFDDFFVHHSCLSAHFQSARLHREGVPNIYERTLYEGPSGEPKFLDSFVIDVFMYPPPFLLLSRLGLALSENFAAWRAVWFGMEGALVAAVLLALAFWIGGPTGRRVALLSPIVWLSFPTLTTLQFGNFHLVAIAGSVLAMLAFERDRPALGGAVLAALTLGKIFPGIFLLVLAFQRRWRALLWTAGFGASFLVLSYVVLGQGVFEAFLSYHLPRLSSGATFETLFAHPDTIACNHAVYGLVQKLTLLGMPVGQSSAIGASWAFTFVLVGIATIAAKACSDTRTTSDRLRCALVWLAVIQLASLRAPFTPDTYAQFPLVWILLLLLAAAWGRGSRPLAILMLIGLANLMVPTIEVMPLTLLLALTLVHQVVFLTLCLGVIGVLWRRERPTVVQGQV